MGTPRFRSADHAGFQLTDAWFPPGLTLAPHEHERTVIAVTVEGQWDSVMQQRPYTSAASTLLIEPAGQRHANHFTSATRVLIIQPEAGRCSGLGQAGRVLERAARFRVDGVAALARRIQWELRQPDAAAPLCLEGLSLEIVAVACRAGEPSRRANQPPPWLALAVEYLHAHCMERITVSDVAGALDVHPARLARTFRRHRGASIGSFVRDLRLQKAIGLLTGSTRSICDIAMSTGFADQSHLTRLCVRRTGRTPAEHRRSRD
jgi:AraC-like DNA-binding protein